MNSLKISGNVGKDPVARTSKAGKKMASLTLAHSTGRDEYKKTIWFDVLCFDALAEEVLERVQKGKYIIVEGGFSIETYQKREGGEGISYKILANQIVFDPPRREQPVEEEFSAF